MVVAKYPQISNAWLLTGEGDMFADQTAKQNTIPFYDTDVEKYIAMPARFSIKGYVSLPGMDDAEFAALYNGRAMGETMPPGSMVLMKRVEPQCLIPGGDYVVAGEEFIMLRRVRREADSQMLRLMPVDEANFDEVRVAMGEIREIYLVRGVVVNKTI
jgi:hypothetical protein